MRRISGYPSVLLVVQLFGIVSFLYGFFPAKIPLSGVSSFDEVPNVGKCDIRYINYFRWIEFFAALLL